MRRQRGGAIVNITPYRACAPRPCATAYGTSKAGLAHLTQQQAVELASLGIRVNAVAPGPVDTAWRRTSIRRRSAPPITTPFRSTATAWRKKLAEAIFFLCSARASYITGQTLAVDGGFEAAGIGLPALREDGRNI